MKVEFFRHVVDSVDEGVAVLDREGRLTYANRALAEILGHEPGEMLGRPFRLFIAAEGRGEFDTQREGASDSSETYLVAREGEKLVRMGVHPLFDEEEGFSGSFATITAIGEIRRTEVERQIMAEIARGVAVTDNLDELLKLIHDCLKRVVFSENFYIALYDSVEETISFPYFVDQQDETPARRPRGKTVTDYVLRTGKAVLLTNDLFDHLVAEGEVELVGSPSPSWMGVPLKTPDKTIGVLAVQHYEDEGAFSKRDLELCSSVANHIALAIEKKRADGALQENRQLLASVVESMSNGVVVLNSDFEIIYFSRAMEKISRTSRDRVLRSGKSAWEHFPHLVEVGIAEMMLRAMEGETQRGRGLPYKLPDGTEGFTNDVYRPLRRADGEIRGVLGVVRDVTDRLRVREELQIKEEQLQHAQKMEAVGRLAGGIAHDFNNLLTAINGFADLVLEELPVEDKLNGYVKEIREAGGRAATLTQKLLALSRKQVVEAYPLEINSLIERFRPIVERVAGEHVEVAIELAAKPLPTLLDPTQVEQIVLNLVVNALDAMPGGGRLVIETLRERLDEHSAAHTIVPGDYVGFEVGDTGTGMSEETRARVFEPFFTTKETGKGTGLGLAIVYGIVKQNKGYIWVKSEPGKGSSFRVLFPQTDREVVSQVAGRVARAGSQRVSDTVLVVEDERGVRSLIGKILGRNGYRVVEAASAIEALEILRDPEAIFDLVVTDVVMPQMSGPELARRLAKSHADLGILFISGHPGETMKNQGLDENAELLPKPFTADALVERVRKILGDLRDTPAN